MNKTTVHLHRLTLWIALIVVALAARSAHAVILSDANDRVVAPGQITFGVDLDGVAVIGTALSPAPQSFDDVFVDCGAALITNRHLLTAAHCLDQDEDGQVDPLIASFPFVAGFELTGGKLFIPVDSHAVQFSPDWPQSGDLAVLELQHDAPPQIPRYPLYGLADEIGRTVVIAGYGETGHGATGVDPVASATRAKRAGLNRYEAIRDDLFLVYDFDSGLEANNALALTGFPSDLGFGIDEVLSGHGDSGSATFINGVLAGVVSTGARLPEADVDALLNGSWGEGASDTRVSHYREFITTATGGQAVFVPEPPAATLVVSALVVILLRKMEHGFRRARFRRNQPALNVSSRGARGLRSHIAPQDGT